MCAEQRKLFSSPAAGGAQGMGKRKAKRAKVNPKASGDEGEKGTGDDKEAAWGRRVEGHAER